MANRFDQIPENPNLYKQQSMFVPKEYIPTEMPDAPLNIPIDIYKADLKKRTEDKAKLDDDISKFNAEHFKILGTDVTSTYNGDNANIDQRKMYKSLSDEYSGITNQILEAYSNNPTAGRAMIRRLQDKRLGDSRLSTIETNTDKLKQYEKQISESSDNPIVENQNYYEAIGELQDAAKRGEVIDLKPATKIKLGSKEDAVSKLHDSIKYDEFGGEDFVVDEKKGIAYTKSGKTKNVSELRMHNNFVNAWNNEPRFAQQVKAEAMGYAKYAGYNVGKANNYLESLLTPEEKGLSQKEKESIFAKKLKDKEILGTYNQYINNGINSNYQANVSGYVGKDKLNEVKGQVYDKYSEFTQNDLKKSFYNKFGITDIRSMSNINWEPFNKGAGAGSKLQPKTVAAFNHENMSLGLNNIIDPESNQTSSSLYNAIDPDTGLLKEGTDPKLNESLSYLDNSMGQAITSMLGEGFIEDFKEAYGDKKITNSQIFNMLNANANNWIDGSKYAETMKKIASSGKYESLKGKDGISTALTGRNYSNIDSKKLNESLNSLVKNDITKESVTFAKSDNKIINGSMESLFQSAMSTVLANPNNLGNVKIISNGKEYDAKYEDINKINKGENNTTTQSVKFSNSNGKISAQFHIKEKADNGDPISKIIKLDLDSNNANQKSSIAPIIKTMYDQNDPISRQQAVSTAALTLSNNPDKIRSAMTFKNGASKPSNVNIENPDGTGSILIVYDEVKNDNGAIVGYKPKASLNFYDKNSGSKKIIKTIVTDKLNEALIHSINEEDANLAGLPLK